MSGDIAHILLLGGTSETAPLADKIAAAGYRVLVSTATDAPLATGSHAAIARRCGPLDAAAMAAVLRQHGIAAIVDATHPYAEQIHATARQVAAASQCPYLRYQRRAAVVASAAVDYADDHRHAASLACRSGERVLLTTGSRHLAEYVAAARHHGCALFARVLNHPDSVAACAAAGLKRNNCLFARGPFSHADNLALLRRWRITRLVTKDSGSAGGVAEKISAARQHGCGVVVLRRPDDNNNNYTSMDALVAALPPQGGKAKR